MAMELLLDTTSSGSDCDEHHIVPHLEGWTKRKRSRRHRSEEEHLALCLLTLAHSGSRVLPAPRPQPTTTATTPAEFKCSVCGKCFSSYQALGGHKTSHRVKPAAVTDQPATSISAGSSVTAGSVTLSPDQAGGRVHKCSICLREFATGQALGGHKRKHSEGGVMMAAAAENISEAASSGNRRFDLNLPAVPEFAGFDVARRCVVAKWEEEEEEVQSPLAFKKPRLIIQA